MPVDLISMNEEMQRIIKDRKTAESRYELLQRHRDEELIRRYVERTAALLDITPFHDRTSCSDSKPDNKGGMPPRCMRCYLLGVEKDQIWEIPHTLKLTFQEPDNL